MSVSDSTVARRVVSDLLVGTRLDSLRVYSMVLYLCFERIEEDPRLPRDLWVSGTGRISSNGDSTPLGSSLASANELSCTDEFFKHRADVIKEIYLLIGHTVETVQIDEDNKLIINFAQTAITFGKDVTDLEVIWSVMSESADESVPHEWYVGLTDTSELVVKVKGVAGSFYGNGRATS